MTDFGTLSMKPTGWFQIGWSAEFQPGDVRPLRYFGEDLVAYRGRSGSLVVLDGHCPHLGAHLGYGGQVQGEDIQCPFHGWQWGPDGRNTCIPYQDRTSKARRARAWPTVEHNGVVYLWHDLEGREPTCEVPELFGLFPDAGAAAHYPDPYPEGTMHAEGLRLHPQFVAENGVDYAHFKYVHRAQEAPEILSREVDEWTFRTTMSLRFTIRGEGQETTTILGGLRAHLVGLGLSYAYAWGSGGVCSLTAATPVDDEVSDLRFTAWVDTSDDPDEALLERRRRSAIAQVKADLNIWEHQRYTEPPVLATAEAAGFKEIRAWARGFYPSPQTIRSEQ